MERFDASDETLSDGTIVSWIAVGEYAAVEPLIRRYQKPLMTLLVRAAGDRHTAEDLCQETWIRVVRGAKRFDPAMPFRPWLFRIAWNLLRNATEKSRNRREEQFDAERHASGSSSSSDKSVEERESGRRTRELIASLPPRLAETVLLKYFEDLTEKEVAARLGVPVGTVKSRLHNAMNRLALAMKANS